MSSAHIHIAPGASSQASELLQFVNELQRTQDRGRKLKSVFDQIAMSGDWDALAAKLGCTPTEAEAVYNLLGSVNTTLTTGAFVGQILSRLG